MRTLFCGIREDDGDGDGDGDGTEADDDDSDWEARDRSPDPRGGASGRDRRGEDPEVSLAFDRSCERELFEVELLSVAVVVVLGALVECNTGGATPEKSIASLRCSGFVPIDARAEVARWEIVPTGKPEDVLPFFEAF